MKNGPMGIPADISMDCYEANSGSHCAGWALKRELICLGGNIWVWINTYYNTIFNGMNIHLPAILGFTRYQGFDPSPYLENYGLLHAWNLWGWFQRYAGSSDCHCFTPKWASVIWEDVRPPKLVISHHQSHFYCFPIRIQIFFFATESSNWSKNERLEESNDERHFSVLGWFPISSSNFLGSSLSAC